jgi:hypothetical protein
LVVVLDKDILTGADFAAFKRKDYRSANSALRAEWAFWRRTCPKYRFGRHELMPVKSNAKGISRYVGKYISKHVSQRLLADKGARVVRFIGYKPGMRRVSQRFSWNTANGWLWRHKVAAFAGRYGITGIEQMRMFFGPRWAHHQQDKILGELLEGAAFPSRTAAERCLDQAFPMVRERYDAKEILEKIPATQSRLLSDKKFDRDMPIWAVPEWFGEKPAVEVSCSEQMREAEEQAREMRLYALRLPLMQEPRKIKWVD